MAEKVTSKAAQAMVERVQPQVEKTVVMWGGDGAGEVKALEGEEKTRVDMFVLKQSAEIIKKQQRGEDLAPWELRILQAVEVNQTSGELSPEQKAAVYIAARQGGNEDLCNRLFLNMTGKERYSPKVIVRKLISGGFEPTNEIISEDREKSFAIEQEHVRAFKEVEKDTAFTGKSPAEKDAEAWSRVFKGFCGKETDKLQAELEMGIHGLEQGQIAQKLEADKLYVTQHKAEFATVAADITQLEADKTIVEGDLPTLETQMNTAKTAWETAVAASQADTANGGLRKAAADRKGEYDKAVEAYNKKRAEADGLKRKIAEKKEIQVEYPECKTRVKALESLSGSKFLGETRNKKNVKSFDEFRTLAGGFSSTEWSDGDLQANLSAYTGETFTNSAAAQKRMEKFSFAELLEFIIKSLAETAQS